VATRLLTKEVKIWKFALGFSAGIACLILSRSSTRCFARCSRTCCCCCYCGGESQASLSGIHGHGVRRPHSGVLAGGFEYSAGLDFLLQPFIATTARMRRFPGARIYGRCFVNISATSRCWAAVTGPIGVGPLPRSPSTATMEKYSNYYPSEGHNGYLENLNDLGYIGLMCLLGFLVVFLRQSLAQLKIGYEQVTIYVALLLEELVSNMTSSEWLQPGSLSTPIVMLATFALAGHSWISDCMVSPANSRGDSAHQASAC